MCKGGSCAPIQLEAKGVFIYMGVSFRLGRPPIVSKGMKETEREEKSLQWKGGSLANSQTIVKDYPFSEEGEDTERDGRARGIT